MLVLVKLHVVCQGAIGCSGLMGTVYDSHAESQEIESQPNPINDLSG